MTTLRFKSKDELNFFQENAKEKYNIPFSKYIRMLIDEDLKGERKSKEKIEEENKIIEELKFENEFFRKEISILKEHFTFTVELNTNRILQKLNNLTIQIPDFMQHEASILELLNKNIKGKRVKLSLTEISLQINLPEQVIMRILDNLIEKETVKLSQNMKYGRID
ncbi:MAG: hypothetical protein EAX96_01150 [Candidatus Lokiarchaeota archaeon]|nr:hypothetical protein [Candidatus Lokiarchaeota archaeon]